MRPAWGLLSASYLVLVPRRGCCWGRGRRVSTRRSSAAPGSTPGGNIASSAMAVTGFLVLARAWRASGLDGSTPAGAGGRPAGGAPGGRGAGRTRIWWPGSPPPSRGDPSAVGDVVTDLLDGSLFVVAVPVLRAALGLGGGLVAWPWLLLTASVISWLGYDANGRLRRRRRARRPRPSGWPRRCCAPWGPASLSPPGVAQRWVMTELRPAR